MRGNAWQKCKNSVVFASMRDFCLTQAAAELPEKHFFGRDKLQQVCLIPCSVLTGCDVCLACRWQGSHAVNAQKYGVHGKLHYMQSLCVDIVCITPECCPKPLGRHYLQKMLQQGFPQKPSRLLRRSSSEQAAPPVAISMSAVPANAFVTIWLIPTQVLLFRVPPCQRLGPESMKDFTDMEVHGNMQCKHHVLVVLQLLCFPELPGTHLCCILCCGKTLSRPVPLFSCRL